MAQFTKLTSSVMPLPVNDIDTDQIIPAKFLKVTDKNGLADALFFNWRYNDDGSPKTDFILNRPKSKGAKILLAGDNFGCGSSREHAPWALTAYGFRAVISTSFADIFRNNALKNGLIPIIVDEATHKMLFDLLEEIPTAEFTVDLEAQTLSFDAAGGTKRGNERIFPLHVARALEEFNVLRVGSGPAAFDEGHAEIIESLRDADFVIGRKREAFGLRPVAESRVVDLDLLHKYSYMSLRGG